jgi:UDP-N-acetyl-D-galactosamine dehydrogenase
VDPYYLTHRAEVAGYVPEVVLAGRRINDGMGAFVAQETLRRLLRRGADLSAVVLGVTFKEGVPDVRNSRSVDIVRGLQSFGVRVQAHDPLADPAHARDELGIELVPADRLEPAGAVVVAVAHEAYRTGGWPLVTSLLRGGAGIAMDVKAVLDRSAVPRGVDLWRL